MSNAISDNYVLSKNLSNNLRFHKRIIVKYEILYELKFRINSLFWLSNSRIEILDTTGVLMIYILRLNETKHYCKEIFILWFFYINTDLICQYWL